MSAQHPTIAILGSGPAGLGAAFRLAREDRARVRVFERGSLPGGNAGSWEMHGLHLDYGSHRLHPSCDPRVFADIRELLGDDLLDRPRHGRIRLRGRWIHFPLKPHDLLLRLPPAFGAGVLKDAATKRFKKAVHNGEETFATVLEAGLGHTICRDFYFPYAVKMWGESPEALSPIQARKRVSAGSLGKMVRRVMGMVPGLKKPGAGRFFYPREGFGQISRAYGDAAVAAGAEISYDTEVVGLSPRPAGGWTISSRHGEAVSEFEADQVWSTIPVTAVAHALGDRTPEAIRTAAAKIRYRSMVLAYLVLPVDQFSEFDAHYFPEAHLPFTRMSEPKNYAERSEPKGLTCLCLEIPCNPDDALWSMDEAAVGARVEEGLKAAGLPLPCPPREVHLRRLRFAYPIYDIGYDKAFEPLDQWVLGLPDFVSFGRQGLFAHDNTHHALAMAYAAVECLTEGGGFDRARWDGYREEFRSHVVED